MLPFWADPNLYLKENDARISKRKGTQCKVLCSSIWPNFILRYWHPPIVSFSGFSPFQLPEFLFVIFFKLIFVKEASTEDKRLLMERTPGPLLSSHRASSLHCHVFPGIEMTSNKSHVAQPTKMHCQSKALRRETQWNLVINGNYCKLSVCEGLLKLKIAIIIRLCISRVWSLIISGFWEVVIKTLWSLWLFILM